MEAWEYGITGAWNGDRKLTLGVGPGNHRRLGQRNTDPSPDTAHATKRKVRGHHHGNHTKMHHQCNDNTSHVNYPVHVYMYSIIAETNLSSQS